MRVYLALPLVLLLSGCVGITAQPVTAKFPDAPQVLVQECDALKVATENMKLSEYTKVVVDNYMKYHQCAAKVKGWNEWYSQQKTIFEDATKH